MSSAAGHPDGNLATRLAAVLSTCGAAAEIGDLVRLSGGASRQTWRFTARIQGVARTLVLRRDPPGAPRSGVHLEGALLTAAARHRVPVPEVVAASDDPALLGSPFVIMAYVEGETIPRRILRDEQLAGARAALTGQCARAVAAIHRIPPEEVPGLPEGDPLEAVGTLLWRGAQPHPAFELALRWLAEHRPAPSGRVVVHGDFRNGNLIVGPDGLRAVLDWELAHVGDPLEDLGWLCVKAWRFGAPKAVGGFGTVAELVAAYQAAAGRTIDGDALHWWEVLGTLRWGVICIVQALTHTTGAVPSVELAAVGRRVCEVEWDLLELLHPLATGGGLGDGRHADAADDQRTGAGRPGAAGGFSDVPHDLPGAAELLRAVGGFLTEEVMPATEGRTRFLSRVAANVVAMVARQLELGAAQRAAHGARLAALGVADEAELAAAIRGGRLDDRYREVVAAVRATVADKLAVANPAI